MAALRQNKQISWFIQLVNHRSPKKVFKTYHTFVHHMTDVSFTKDQIYTSLAKTNKQKKPQPTL